MKFMYLLISSLLNFAQASLLLSGFYLEVALLSTMLLVVYVIFDLQFKLKKMKQKTTKVR